MTGCKGQWVAVMSVCAERQGEDGSAKSAQAQRTQRFFLPRPWCAGGSFRGAHSFFGPERCRGSDLRVLCASAFSAFGGSRHDRSQRNSPDRRGRSSPRARRRRQP